MASKVTDMGKMAKVVVRCRVVRGVKFWWLLGRWRPTFTPPSTLNDWLRRGVDWAFSQRRALLSHRMGTGGGHPLATGKKKIHPPPRAAPQSKLFSSSSPSTSPRETSQQHRSTLYLDSVGSHIFRERTNLDDTSFLFTPVAALLSLRPFFFVPPHPR